MLITLSYNICALVILVILLVLNIIKERPMFQPNIYLIAAIAAFIFSDISNTLYYLVTVSEPDNHAAVIVVTYFYIICICAASFFPALCFLSQTYLRYFSLKRIQLVLMSTPFIVMLTLIVTNPVSHIFFTYENGIFISEPYIPVVFSIMFTFYTIVSIAMVIRLRHTIQTQIKASILAMLIIWNVTAIVQLHTENNLIFNFGAATGLMIIYLTSLNMDSPYNPIIGIFNRYAFTTFTSQSERERSDFTAIIIHLENVDLLNQKFGNDVVDAQVFRQFAKFLTNTVTGSVFYLNDCIFAITMDKYNYNSADGYAVAIADRLQHTWKFDAHSEVVLSAMTGIIRFSENSFSTGRIFDFITHVKKLKSSQSDRNIIHAHDIEFENKEHRKQLDNAITAALHDPDRFEIYYQPIYSATDGVFTSAEALLRIKDPKYGMIPPDEFIPIAEANGTIAQVGIIVFEKICQFYNQHKLAEKRLNCININLSLIQCMLENLYDIFSEIMYKYKVNPSNINLEITESAITQTPRMLQINMTALHNHGVKFTLDDYGTGYSSVSRLVDLPFETIKIDRSMLWSASTHNQKAVIALTSSIRMLQEMNLSIVAEGVETEEQAKYLIGLGCDCLQGYYYCRPLPADDFLKFIENYDM